MPKNAQGQVKCINDGTSISNGSSVHPMLKVEGFAVMPKGERDAAGIIAVDTTKVQEFEVHICDNCKYTELYKRI